MNTKIGISNQRSEKEIKVRHSEESLRNFWDHYLLDQYMHLGLPGGAEREQDRKLIQGNNAGKLSKYENCKLFYGSLVVTTKKIPRRYTKEKGMKVYG